MPPSSPSSLPSDPSIPAQSRRIAGLLNKSGATTFLAAAFPDCAADLRATLVDALAQQPVANLLQVQAFPPSDPAMVGVPLWVARPALCGADGSKGANDWPVALYQWTQDQHAPWVGGFGLGLGGLGVGPGNKRGGVTTLAPTPGAWDWSLRSGIEFMAAEVVTEACVEFFASGEVMSQMVHDIINASANGTRNRMLQAVVLDHLRTSGKLTEREVRTVTAWSAGERRSVVVVDGDGPGGSRGSGSTDSAASGGSERRRQKRIVQWLEDIQDEDENPESGEKKDGDEQENENGAPAPDPSTNNKFTSPDRLRLTNVPRTNPIAVRALNFWAMYSIPGPPRTHWLAHRLEESMNLLPANDTKPGFILSHMLDGSLAYTELEIAVAEGVMRAMDDPVVQGFIRHIVRGATRRAVAVTFFGSTESTMPGSGPVLQAAISRRMLERPGEIPSGLVSAVASAITHELCRLRVPRTRKERTEETVGSDDSEDLELDGIDNTVEEGVQAIYWQVAQGAAEGLFRGFFSLSRERFKKLFDEAWEDTRKRAIQQMSGVVPGQLAENSRVERTRQRAGISRG